MLVALPPAALLRVRVPRAACSPSLFPLAVCPPGWFGPECQLSCSCGNEGHCHPVTGTCSCPPGWTGYHCQRGTAPVLCHPHPWATLAMLPCLHSHLHAVPLPGKSLCDPFGFFALSVRGWQCHWPLCSCDCPCAQGMLCLLKAALCPCRALGYTPVMFSCRVFAACDLGRWGPDCAHACNCSNSDGSCSAQTGQCLCEAGYTGTRCEQSECCPCPAAFTPTQGLGGSRERHSPSPVPIPGCDADPVPRVAG